MAHNSYRKLKEKTIETALFLSALSSVLITIGIVVVLSYESFGFFKEISLREFFTETQWTPLFAEPKFGILPLVSGTLLTTALALIVALPLGLTVTVYLSEYAPHKVREVIKPILELLAAVPTVVYGYFALLFFNADTPEIHTRPFRIQCIKPGDNHGNNDNPLCKLCK